MKLILEKDVKNLGKAGDEISVKPGYARNYLLPQKLATTLNETRIKEWKHKHYIIEIRKKKAEEERKKTISCLDKIHLTFEKEARSQGQLFGSVSSGEISKVLEEQHNLSIDKRDILSDPLKTTGIHKVKIALDSKRETFLSITIKKVSAKKESPEVTSPSQQAEAEALQNSSVNETKNTSNFLNNKESTDSTTATKKQSTFKNLKSN